MKTIKRIITLTLLIVTQLILAQGTEKGYCKVQSATSNNYITNVQFSDIKNTSELGINGYSDFTNKIANVNIGKSYAIKVDTKWNHWPYNSIQVWIDWNGDSNFELTERVFYKTNSGTLSGLVNVPANAKLGETRMRVRYNYDIELRACEVNTREMGEVEDYTIAVLNAIAPTSNFTANITNVTNQREFVTFNDLSEGNPTSWLWEFEGGTPARSTERNPSVYYGQSGSYSVRLVTKNEHGEHVKNVFDYITVNFLDIERAPISNFLSEITNVTNDNQYVNFQDASENNPTSWSWVFEGGIPATSREQNPKILYKESGSYSVKLIVENRVGGDVKIVENFITVNLPSKEICNGRNERPAGQYITAVEIESVRNRTSYSERGYDSYNLGTTVVKRSINNINEATVMHVKTNAVWGNTQTKYWVDWNQDGDFLDEGEERLLEKPSSSEGEWLSLFFVPTSAKLGETRLRIRTVYGSELTACGDTWFGETEDYVITVVREPQPEPEFFGFVQNVTAFPNPSANGRFTFSCSSLAKKVTFKVFNDRSTLVFTASDIAISDGLVSLDLSVLEKGAYFIQTTIESKIETIRVIIE